MKPVGRRLTLIAARAVHLAAQGLLRAPTRQARKNDVLACIQRMRLLQIDTINVVARSPYLVLFSRLGAYPQAWLDELLEDGAIFETWAHEACFAPTGDVDLLRAHLLDKTHHWALRNATRLREEQGEGMQRILDHIRERGPVRSSDFERVEGQRSGGWWGWTDQKRWLEAWFGLGELMVARRERFQRVYDLTDRVLANAGVRLGESAIAAAEVRRILVERAIAALGVARPEWLADYFRLRPRVSGDEVETLVDAGLVQRVEVVGWDAPAYVHIDNGALVEAAAAGRLRATSTTLLSPFDPVVWDRARASDFFGFDYRLECYLPASRRRHGYFVLPVLHRGRLVGRVDAKAHRQDRVFEVRRFELDDGIQPGDAGVMAIGKAIALFAHWHGAHQLSWGRIEPRSLAVALRRIAASALASIAAQPDRSSLRHDRLTGV